MCSFSYLVDTNEKISQFNQKNYDNIRFDSITFTRFWSNQPYVLTSKNEVLLLASSYPCLVDFFLQTCVIFAESYIYGLFFWCFILVLINLANGSKALSLYIHTQA